MSLPFAQSERSLQKDDYRLALVCGVIALPLFLAWLIWFFTGDLPIYSISQQLSPGVQGTVIADFAATDIHGLQLGDSMVLHLQLADGQEVTTVPVTVTDIFPQPDGQYDVQLLPTTDYRHLDFSTDLSGQARYAAGDQSPFSYLLQLGDDD